MRPTRRPPRPCREAVEDAAATFRVLAAPARLELLWLLAAGERDVVDRRAARGLGPGGRHHLGRLRPAGRSASVGTDGDGSTPPTTGGDRHDRGRCGHSGTTGALSPPAAADHA